jgi:hypothetical protein
LRSWRSDRPFGHFFLENGMSSFIVKGTGGTFETAPAGMHLARCYQIIDLGTQRTTYDGTIKFLPQLRLGWELHVVDENGKPVLMNDGRPFSIYKPYTNSLNEKSTLRKHLQSWRGKPFTQKEIDGFDMKNILDTWCMLTVIHKTSEKGGKYANIDTVTQLPVVVKQAGMPKAVNACQMFSLSDPDMDVFNSLSEKLKASIMATNEWSRIPNKPSAQVAQVAQPAFEDDGDIPF